MLVTRMKLAIRTPRLYGAVSVLALAGFMAGSPAAAPTATSGKTMGLVVTYFWYANYEGADDCPEGAARGMRRLAEPYLAKMNPEQRAKLLTPGNEQQLAGVLSAFALGGTAYGDAIDVRNEMFGPLLAPGAKRPAGRYGVTPVQDQCSHPQQFEDPPLRTVKGRVAFGLNLDGGDDPAKSTPNTCKHQNFTGPQGELGIDNQLYRAVGCVDGYRRRAATESATSVSAGTMEDWFHGVRKDGATTLLIEINGVDDPRNDDDVEVVLYSSRQSTPFDSTGLNGVPSYSLTATTPAVGARNIAHGRIVDGVLTTDPAVLSVPSKPAGVEKETSYDFRDGRFRLELSPDGSAKGILAGYFDVEKAYYIEMASYYDTARRNAVYDGSCPAIYAAMHELADGYPDATGRCTAISTAFKVEAVKAYVIHQDQKTVQAK